MFSRNNWKSKKRTAPPSVLQKCAGWRKGKAGRNWYCQGAWTLQVRNDLGGKASGRTRR